MSSHAPKPAAFSCPWCQGDGQGDHAVDCAKRSAHPLDPRAASRSTAICPDSPTRRHQANPERYGDTICIWCLEETAGPVVPSPRPSRGAAR